MSNHSAPMVEVQHLVFEYPGVCVLDDVSFAIPRGEVTAMVGPNGAGKTTLLRCLAALEQPISGGIAIDGIDALAHPRSCHRKVGYVSDFFGLYGELSVGQSLHYVARAHGIAAQGVAQAVEKAARRLQLLDRLDAKTRTLSRGLRQRLAIAQAIVHEPELLLLDEPASGLDPEARRHLSDLFLALQAQGMTLIVSSHILAELADYATSMLIVQGGRIIDNQSLREANAAAVPLALTLAGPVADLADRLAAQPGVRDVKATETTAHFHFSSDREAQRLLLATLIQAGLPVCGFVEARTNLQDAYLASVGASEGTAP